MRGTLDKSSQRRCENLSGIETIRREGLELDVAWLAGFLDGEASFRLCFEKQSQDDPNIRLKCAITVENTAIEPMVRMGQVLKELGFGFTYHWRKGKGLQNEKWRDTIRIKVSGQETLRKLCRILEPHLTCKREQAKQIIYAVDYRKGLSTSQHSQFVPAIADDPILKAMVQRVKQMIHFRPELGEYSRVRGGYLSAKKPSTTTRLAALSADEIRQMI